MALNSDPEQRRSDLSCAQVRDTLPLLVGEELDTPLADATRSHLTSCHACARELGGYLQARRALKSVSAAALSEAAPSETAPSETAPSETASSETASSESAPQAEGAPGEEFFSRLQSSILAQVAREPAPLVRLAERRAVAVRRLLAAASMAALFAVGLTVVLWFRPNEPRLLGNEPMAVPTRSSLPGAEGPGVLENLARRRSAPRPPAQVPRFGLQARADSQLVLLAAQEARAVLRGGVRTGR